jgi:hypothetical protein
LKTERPGRTVYRFDYFGPDGAYLTYREQRPWEHYRLLAEEAEDIREGDLSVPMKDIGFLGQHCALASIELDVVPHGFACLQPDF